MKETTREYLRNAKTKFNRFSEGCAVVFMAIALLIIVAAMVATVFESLAK